MEKIGSSKSKQTKAPKPAKALKSMLGTDISSSDMQRCLDGFLHFTGKTVHSSVSNVSIRLADGHARPELPYLGLSTLGASLQELDYTEGGAGFVRKPRQIKDMITAKSSGVDWDMSKVSNNTLLALTPGGLFAQSVKLPSADLPHTVPALLRQVIVQHNGQDISVTPIGAIGFNSMIISRLNAEKIRRESLANKANKEFWGKAANILGGKKPQNIGLICAVVGGPIAAGFAWHFKAPSVPTLRLRQRLATLFRQFNQTLSSTQASELRGHLLALIEKDDSHKRYALERFLDEMGRTIVANCQIWRASFLEQLTLDFGASVLPGNIKDDLINELRSGNLPERNREHWEWVQQKLDDDVIYLGWLSKSKSMQWAQMASDQLVRGWLRQLELPISTTYERMMSQHLAREIV